MPPSPTFSDFPAALHSRQRIADPGSRSQGAYSQEFIQPQQNVQHQNFKKYNKYVEGKTPDLFCLLVLVRVLHLFFGIMIRGAIPTKIDRKISK